MYVFGPISSLFDFMTFYLLYAVFHLSGSMFQTGWFIESLATQVLVVYVIRTKSVPFFRSKPSGYLIASTLSAVLMGWIFISTFLGNYFGFTSLPPKLLGLIFILVLIYLALVEITKTFFYRWVEKKKI